MSASPRKGVLAALLYSNAILNVFRSPRRVSGLVNTGAYL